MSNLGLKFRYFNPKTRKLTNVKIGLIFFNHAFRDMFCDENSFPCSLKPDRSPCRPGLEGEDGGCAEHFVAFRGISCVFTCVLCKCVMCKCALVQCAQCALLCSSSLTCSSDPEPTTWRWLHFGFLPSPTQPFRAKFRDYSDSLPLFMTLTYWALVSNFGKVVLDCNVDLMKRSRESLPHTLAEASVTSFTIRSTATV